MSESHHRVQQINSKTLARIAAVQVLYQYQLAQAENQNIDIDGITKQILKFYDNTELKNDFEVQDKRLKLKLNKQFFGDLVNLTTKNISEIDKLIQDNISRENFLEKNAPLLLAILRVAVCNLVFYLKSSAKTVVSDFTDITNNMLSDFEVGFVNSVLDNIAKTHKLHNQQ